MSSSVQTTTDTAETRKAAATRKAKDASAANSTRPAKAAEAAQPPKLSKPAHRATAATPHSKPKPAHPLPTTRERGAAKAVTATAAVAAETRPDDREHLASAASPGRSEPQGRAVTKQVTAALRAADRKPARASSKLAQIEALLRQEGGTTIAALMSATGWQRHSVHGVLSGTFKTKRGLVLTRSQSADGVTLYAIKA